MKHKLLWEFPKSLETSRLIVKKCEKGVGADDFVLFERNNNREELKEYVGDANFVKTDE
jgi:hypothetical protein